ncbi:MAG: heavy metal translocating P-type ATPase, partial [Candidatus Woesearchaeota archaeon]
MVKKVYKVEGMHCASCASSEEKALKGVDGIKDARVNIATEKASIETDKSISFESVQKAVRDAGYDVEDDAETETSTFKVKGMSCASCAKAIEGKLKDIDGISSTNLNFANERLTVKHDSDKIKAGDIKTAISAIGYELESEDSEDQQEDKDDLEIMRSKKNLVIASSVSAIIMVLMVIHMFVTSVPGYLSIISILAFPVIFILGAHVHKASIKSIMNGTPNMDVLVSLGSVPPYLIGLLGFFLPVQSFIEMASTIMTFHLIGKFLESRAKGKASQAIKKLLHMGAKSANVLRDKKEINIPVKELDKGDIMMIRHGEKIPTDGVVVSGESSVDESMATGESIPEKKKKDSQVIGATINKTGMLKVKVTKLGKETFLSQVVKMVEEAQGSRVPIQDFADKITGYFVPAILMITLLTFISFNIFSSFHMSIVEWGAQFLPWVNPSLDALTLSFITATAVLVIACPCALGLGTPTALMVGSGLGAERGILIRNGEAVQTMKDIKSIAFDKTGTLTKGKPEVTDIETENKVKVDELLEIAGSLENSSEHPLAQAIVNKAKNKKITLKQSHNFKAIEGKGVKGKVGNDDVIIGTRTLMESQGLDISSLEDKMTNLENQAKTVIIVAKRKKILGLIAITDPIKEDSARALEELHKQGIKTAMITGD